MLRDRIGHCLPVADTVKGVLTLNPENGQEKHPGTVVSQLACEPGHDLR